eukprot:PhF_6_TR10367/c0_g2_i4/m.16108
MSNQILVYLITLSFVTSTLSASPSATADTLCDLVSGTSAPSPQLILINESVTFTETCLVQSPDSQRHIVCKSPSVVVTCSVPRGPCFALDHIDHVRLSNCTFRGGAAFTIENTLTVTVSNCVFNGRNVDTPLWIHNSIDVVIVDSLFEDGLGQSIWKGGGCLSISGVTGQVELVRVTARRCSAGLPGGGCVIVTGDNSTSFREMLDTVLPSESYGGFVRIESSLF